MYIRSLINITQVGGFCKNDQIEDREERVQNCDFCLI